jgi:3-hydroxyisobutyrate dehydrogenase-like beta-hydroxyacid dehydrogenase
VTNHRATAEVLRPLAGNLAGKLVVDLSTGHAADAEALAALVEAAGATWLIGMINGYPGDIGRPATAILCAGPKQAWTRAAGMVRLLGGASAHVGTAAVAIPGLFAAMFTARQAFMFGLAYGGAACRRAGLPIETFVAQMEVTLGMVRSYAALFSETVPGRQYDGSAAPVAVYVDALADALTTFEATGTEDALPRLMRDLALRAMAEGRGDKALTVLVEMLGAAAVSPVGQAGPAGA